jgi:hypothetical protein
MPETEVGGSQSRLALGKKYKTYLKTKEKKGWEHESSGRTLAGKFLGDF